MKQIIALSVLVSLVGPSAFADGLLPQKTAPAVTQVETKTETIEAPKQAQVVKNHIQIDATKSQIQLHSRLRKQYTGYAYTISNNTPDQLELMHAEIVNGMNGQGAALGVQKSSAAAIGSVLGGGLVLGIVTFGISFLAGLVATPFIYGINAHKNNKAIAEGMPYSNQVPTGIIPAGDSIQFNTLTPLNQTPQVKMTFRNSVTNEIFAVTR